MLPHYARPRPMSYDRLRREAHSNGHRDIADHTALWDQLVPIASLQDDGDPKRRVLQFCERKRISWDALEALGARFTWRDGLPCLAYAGRNGNGSIITAIKYRPMDGTSHDSVQQPRSNWLRPIIIGNRDSLDWMIAEGETDGARLYGLVGDRCVILTLPLGAKTWKAEWGAIIPSGATVGLALDGDTDGDIGAEKIANAIPMRTIRVRPPNGDWCDWNGDAAAFLEIVRQSRAERDTFWLSGSPMDPAAEKPEPLPTLPGFPFLHAGCSAMIVGPTGGGRSSLIEACIYDAARAGLPCLYLGHEVTEPEFNARAASLAEVRGDAVTDTLRAELARTRYLDLTDTIARAWDDAAAWVDGIAQLYRVVVFDPLSAVESALDLNFEQRNTDYIRFFDRIIKPVTARGVAVVLIDNVGHADEARERAKGASAKGDRADLTFSCALVSDGLLMKIHKVRSIRTAFTRGQKWLFVKETQTIESQAAESGEFRPTKLMEKASVYIETNPNEGVRAIRCGVGGKPDYVDKAVKCLVEEGFVEVRSYGQKRAHYSLKPFRESADSPSETVRNRVRDTVPF